MFAHTRHLFSRRKNGRHSRGGQRGSRRGVIVPRGGTSTSTGSTSEMRVLNAMSHQMTSLSPSTHRPKPQTGRRTALSEHLYTTRNLSASVKPVGLFFFGFYETFVSVRIFVAGRQSGTQTVWWRIRWLFRCGNVAGAPLSRSDSHGAFRVGVSEWCHGQFIDRIGAERDAADGGGGDVRFSVLWNPGERGF